MPGNPLVVRAIVFDRREMAQRGRRGGTSAGQRPERAAILARARATFLDQLANRADPDHLLPDEERLRLARELRRQHLNAIRATRRPREVR